MVVLAHGTLVDLAKSRSSVTASTEGTESQGSVQTRGDERKISGVLWKKSIKETSIRCCRVPHEPSFVLLLLHLQVGWIPKLWDLCLILGADVNVPAVRRKRR